MVGLKGSFGRVPVNPPYYARVAGPLTRTVADAARAMAILSQPDDADFMSLPPEHLDWEQLEMRMAGTRIALVADAGAGMATDPEVARAVESAALTLGDAGALVEPLGPLITDAMLNGLDRFWRMRSLRDLRALPPVNQERMLPYLREWMDAAADGTGMELFQDFSQLEGDQHRRPGRDRWLRLHRLPSGARCHLQRRPPQPRRGSRPGFGAHRLHRDVQHLRPPGGQRPVDHHRRRSPDWDQLVGRRFADVPVLALAAACERLRPELRPGRRRRAKPGSADPGVVSPPDGRPLSVDQG